MLPRVSLLLLLALAFGSAARAEEAPLGIYDPLQKYFTQPPNERFSRFRAEMAAGRAALDPSGEIPLLRSLLKALEVPVSSQSLVYSVTSLQKSLISPRRPRALFFNDDTFVGFVPSGRMEVISMDPELGSIFYIFDRFEGTRVPNVIRSSECMNCHAPHYLDNIPALVIESVIPGLTGGGERAFRREQSGHGVPLTDRFGGWHLTGVSPGWPRLWANTLIEYRGGQPVELPLPLGRLSDLSRYPLPTSDLLPQLLQEHQVGFVNRALHAAYRTRALLRNGASPEGEREIAALASDLVRYALFADEAPLPAPVQGDAAFKKDFQANRRPASTGAALKDLELQTHLFRNRCSYMLYTPVFGGLPTALKEETLRQLRAAVSGEDAAFAYLPAAEKKAIRTILSETLPGFGEGRTASVGPAVAPR